MPPVRMFGRKWRMSSDFLPLFAGVGLAIHVCWVIFIIVWPIGILKLRKCNDTKAGRHFLAAVWLCFVLNALSCIQELLITLIGLRGKFTACCQLLHCNAHISLCEMLEVALRHATGSQQAQVDVSSTVCSDDQLSCSNWSCE